MALHTEIAQDSYFHLQNGRALKNLNELLNALKSMDDHTFKHHVNSHKNDFSNWVKHVFHEDELAYGISKTKEKHAMIEIIESNLFPKHQPQKDVLDHKRNFVESTTAKKIRENRKEVYKQIVPVKPVKHKHEIKIVKQPKSKSVFDKNKPKHGPRTEIILKEIPVIKTITNDEIPIHKINEILMKEKEIVIREQKIEEVELRIERELHELNFKKNPQFFNRDFNQGIAIGLLAALIVVLVYWKFFV